MNKRADAELLLVGDELLNGDSQDSHLQYFGGALRDLGVRLSKCFIIGDEKVEITDIVRKRLLQTRVLIVCGGLGPTEDDVTREAVADGLDKPLIFKNNAWKEIQAFFEKHGYPISETNRKQALFPAGATPISNRVGTAPGFSIEKEGCRIFVLPGPPREVVPMVEHAVLPEIHRFFGRREPIFSETFRTTGIGESTLASLVEDIFPQYDMFEFASLFSPRGVDISITDCTGTQNRKILEKHAASFGRELKRILGYKFYGTGKTSIEALIGEALVQKNMTLSIAESLTGGLIGKRITDVPGSSLYFLADVVAYSNESKMDILGVLEETLLRVGAVSEEVCFEMAKGVRERTGATWGLSTTGIAGPGGGSEEKPVGLCYYGLSWQGGEAVEKRIFSGDRDYVRERVVYAALYLLYKHLMSVHPSR